MSFSNRTEAAILNALTGQAGDFGTFTNAPALWAGLSENVPADDGTGNAEPPQASYGRQNTAGLWAAAVQGEPSSVATNAAVTFPEATEVGGWSGGANMEALVFWDLENAGNFIAAGALTNPQPVAQNDIPEFASGAISFTLD